MRARGVCYPAHAFDLDRFAELYAKTLRDLVYLDESVIQKSGGRGSRGLRTLRQKSEGTCRLASKINDNAPS